jgi:hypothetical protein
VELEHFLQVHSDNVGKHDDSFNEFFDRLVYKSVCTSIEEELGDDREGCSSYLGGILEKGLYSANLAYWDDMRQIRDAFFKSNRSAGYLRDQINDPGLVSIEKLNEVYFARAYQALLDRQNESIGVQFENRNKEIVASFSVYLSLLVLSYFIVWGRFVESMRMSLWVTKSMLAIIPIEVIEKVKVIKDFLMATSQAAVRSMKE